APNSKLQAPKKPQARRSKPTCARFAAASDFEVWGLRFGTSLELGIWCLVFRAAVGGDKATTSVPEASEVDSTRVPWPQILGYLLLPTPGLSPPCFWRSLAFISSVG